MTGLDLETLLLLLRADLGAWVALGVASVGLALLVWSCWGSRRVLRKCLVLSLAAHIGIVVYGSTVPAVRKVVRGGTSNPMDRQHIRRNRVAPLPEPGRPTGRPGLAEGGRAASNAPRLEFADAFPELADPQLRVARPPALGRSTIESGSPLQPGPPIAMAEATPRPARVGPDPPQPGPRSDADRSAGGVPPAPATPAPPDMAEVDRTTAAGVSPLGGSGDRKADRSGTAAIESAVGSPDLTLRNDVRLRPGRSSRGQQGTDRPSPSTAAPETGSGRTGIGPAATSAGRMPRGGTAEGRPGAGSSATRPDAMGGPLALEHVTPSARRAMAGGSDLAALGERPAVRTPAEVPKVYRPRVEPDRTGRARLAGASAGSELAVERALDWLARHQDADGRWDAGTARYPDGKAVQGDDDFTSHCPREEICAGECAYWDADTALTGLALLTYLGAGYTHLQGRYAPTVGKGLEFLIGQQRPDGDLRGVSVVVGMYCHAMATLALCEGYALTGDARLRDPAARAVAFLVRSRARDRMAWRYQPGERVGDTSILGWVVMGLKSARVTGIPIPNEASVRRGALAWLDKVSSGQSGGLASYQIGEREKPTPTMTAEAWVCRQFLGVGGPGPASDEAAESLLRNESDRGKTNFYYWYYATLALYQHGGESWSNWNAATRDKIVGLQYSSGHRAGSWDPDESLYGSKGGRIYCTTMAAMTLEVYYRYLRLYNEPKLPLEAGAPPALIPPRREPAAAAFNPEDR